MSGLEEIAIGRMPQPCFLEGFGGEKWDGVSAYALDGQINEFLWWRNVEVKDLNNEKSRYDVAAFIARVKIQKNVESVIGPAIDLSKSNFEKEHIEIFGDSSLLYGVYVESNHRHMFNLSMMLGGLRSEIELRMWNPIKFEQVFQEAKKYLPRL